MNEEALFAEALSRTDAAERAAFLEQACGPDAALRQRIEELLRSHEQAGSFLDKPAMNGGATSDVAPGQWHDANDLPETPLEGVGSRIGPYKLLQQIGEGGMGVVFMAEQQEPVRRMVALKVIKAGMDSAQVIARFEAERQALAMMDHPNIAKVLDANKTPSGRPYFVMELVKGIPITKYCDEQRLSPRQRLELLVPVCQAIQHAHQKGIIHRDIKPTNVLIAAYDGKPVPKVIDFGVAKATGCKLTERTLFTGFGGLVGTFEYMSPEQAEFNALDIDTRSDVYSLGVLLYELLTGSTPLSRQRIKETAIMEVLRLIREEEPPRPSTRLSESKDSLSSVSAQRHMEPAGLVKAVRGEVDWIVMKALDKDRTRRYETANAMARDIARHLADELVEAGPPSAHYRLRKLAWKHRRGLATAAALLLLLAGGAAASTLLAVWALREERLANQRLDEATTQKERAEKAEAAAKDNEAKAKQSEADTNAVLDYFRNMMLSVGRPKDQVGGLGPAVTLRQAVDAAEPGIAKAFAGRPLVEASIRNMMGMTYWYSGDYPQAIQQLKRALALHESTLGPDHPDTLLTRNNLAQLYGAVGRTVESIRVHELNLQQCEAKLSAEHPVTLGFRRNLAMAYRDAGRTDESILLFERSLKQQEAKLGPEHPETFLVRNNLASAHWSVGHTAEAVRLFEQTLKLGKARLGPEDQLVALTRAQLGVCLLHDKKYADAEPLLRESLKLHQAKEPDVWTTFNDQSLLGAALLGQKKYADAEALLFSGYQGMKQRESQIPPQQKNHLYEALQRLVQLCDATGKKDEAAKWRKLLTDTKNTAAKPTSKK